MGGWRERVLKALPILIVTETEEKKVFTLGGMYLENILKGSVVIRL